MTSNVKSILAEKYIVCYKTLILNKININSILAVIYLTKLQNLINRPVIKLIS